MSKFEIINTEKFENRELDVYGNFLEELNLFQKNYVGDDDLIHAVLTCDLIQLPKRLADFQNLFWYPFEEVYDVLVKVKTIGEYKS